MRHSLKLLFLFLLAAGVMSSMYVSDVTKIILRIAIVYVLFVVVFFINVAVLSFFEKRRKTPAERVGKKVFLSGWLFTIMLIISFHAVVEYLLTKDIHIEVSQVEIDGLEKLRGWRMMIYLSYISLIIYSFVFLIQSFIFNYFEKNRIEKELLQLKAMNYETTNQLLQQQIQPHFLFNALNILKSLIRRHPETAEAYLIRLSDFLRVSVTGNKTGLATVKDELNLCEDYMEMQKIRFGNALNYKVNISDTDDCLSRKLPFFSLQPLLENAIKHNEVTHANPLNITIDREGEYVTVKNSLRIKKTMEVSTGNGLSNLEERYQLLSGENIVIVKDESSFAVSLKLL